MKTLKKLTVLFLCIIIAFSSLQIVASAATKTWEPIITIDNVTATSGDTIYVNVNLSENLYGIMAVTFSIGYDSNVLSYKGYRDGLFTRIKNDKLEKYPFSQFYVAEHENYISVVDCENKNCYGNGTIITLEFGVKENVRAGTYPIKMANVRPNEKGESLKGCFANWRGDTINPKLENGSLTVPLTQENCLHSFGDWTVKTENSCTSEGVQTRNCTICGKLESQPIPKADHSFENVWTVDAVATNDEDGMISRHCADCEEKTDYNFFPYEIVLKKGFSNEVGLTVNKAQIDLLKEFMPESEPPKNANDDKGNEGGKNNNTQSPQEDPNPDENQNVLGNEIPEDAGSLIENEKKENRVKTGIAGIIYDYLYTSGANGGIIGIIVKALKEFFEQIFK